MATETLLFVLMAYSCITRILLLEITRKVEGDDFPMLPCKYGTIVVNEDQTHSIYCALSLAEAG